MEKFTKPTSDILAKRSANICSNPDCAALTSGPSSNESRALSVGEAAHIFGAKPGSARFDTTMSNSARSNITNGIWLCRICHKIVDADPQKYPTDILFEWRRNHEEKITQDLGKTSSKIRKKILDHQLEPFKKCSYLAQQIIIDKPKAWEYLLTAEILKNELEPIHFKWQALENSLYALPLKQVPKNQCFEWLRIRLADVTPQVKALSLLMNLGLTKAWGEPGQPGSEIDILRMCTLMAQAAQQLLNWEEEVRFSYLPEEFSPIQEQLKNSAGKQIEKLLEIPKLLNEIFDQSSPSGTYEFIINFELPEGWSEKLNDAMEIAFKNMQAGQQD